MRAGLVLIPNGRKRRTGAKKAVHRRSIGLSDRRLSAALGIPRSTITIACAGISADLSVSREEFSKLKAFAAQKAAEIRVVVAALELY